MEKWDGPMAISPKICVSVKPEMPLPKYAGQIGLDARFKKVKEAGGCEFLPQAAESSPGSCDRPRRLIFPEARPRTRSDAACYLTPRDAGVHPNLKRVTGGPSSRTTRDRKPVQ